MSAPAGAATSAAAHVPRRRILLLLGPAFVAAVAYVDPGNVGTNTLAGARYGYLLVWVVVAANATAGLMQYLSAKLGIVTGRSLPALLRQWLPRGARIAFCAQAELVAMATDLAEVVGGAIALRILFDVPLVEGGLITAIVSMIVLRAGRPHRVQGVLIALLAVVVVGFVAGLLVAPPHPDAVAAGLVPRFRDTGSLVLAAGMLGATVMPHAIYAHSALAVDRHGAAASGPRRARLLAANRVDVTVALVIAGAVNLALLLLGAVALTSDGRAGTIDGVHAALAEHLGAAVAALFAVGLLCSGIASSALGCYSGSVVLGGLLRLRVPVALQRAVTVLPALGVLALGASPSAILIASQVVLSFGIPFAVIPLVVLTSRRSVMGPDVNARPTVWAAALARLAIVVLNAALLVLLATGHG